MNKSIKILVFMVTASSLVVSCVASRIGEQKSLGLNIKNTITADIQTEPTPQGKEDDSADDPTIWINYANPSESRVYGSDKKGGIATYTLNGKEVAYDKIGKINNIDVRQNVVSKGKKIDVLAGTNRTRNDIDIAIIDKQGNLIFEPIEGTEALRNIKVYGFALGYINNQLMAFVNDKQGNVFVYSLERNNNAWKAQLKKEFSVNTQTEGMVVDDDYNTLYLGQEQKGIWRIDLDTYERSLIPQSQEQDNEFIRYDIEGLSIYPTSDKQGYLIASSQGNNSYAVYNRTGDNKYITSFRIVDGTIDGTEETDGLDLVNFNFGKQFPEGFMIVQDGFNYEGKDKKSQNFKIVDWRKIKPLIQLP